MRLGINEFALEDLESGGQRTKLDHYTDHFHVAVHDCDLRSTSGLGHAREIDVVFGDGWLLSVHQPPEDGDRGSVPDGASVQRRFELQRIAARARPTSGFLLWALLDVVVDRYFVVTDAVDDRLDDVEDVGPRRRRSTGRTGGALHASCSR